MIKIEKTSLVKSQKSNFAYNKPQLPTYEREVNLNHIPHYKPIPSQNLLIAGKIALEDFKREYGTPVSSTYLSQIMKDPNISPYQYENLAILRYETIQDIKHMRSYFKSSSFDSYKGYIETLKAYIKDHGSSMNCQECADLMGNLLYEKGIPSTNIFMYSTNKKGEQISRVSHVFTVMGMDKNADLTNPDTWGENALICDIWADKCMKAKDGIEFYKDFFKIDEKLHEFRFEYCPPAFP